VREVACVLCTVPSFSSHCASLFFSCSLLSRRSFFYHFWQNQRVNLRFLGLPRAISNSKSPAKRLLRTRLGHSLAADLLFSKTSCPPLKPSPLLEPGWSSPISLVYLTRLRVLPSARTKPYRRTVLLHNHHPFLLLVIAMKVPLAAPNQASCRVSIWSGLTLVVLTRVQAKPTQDRVPTLLPCQLLEEASLLYVFLKPPLPCWHFLFPIPGER